MYSRRKGNFIILLVTIVLAVVLIGLFAWDKQNQLETSADEMIEKAEWFWNKGDYEKATWQLNIYLQTDHPIEDSTKAYSLLEEYYNELGKSSDALTCRSKIAELNGKTAISNNEIVISAANVVDLVEKGQKSSNIVIEADYYDTNAMVLQVTSSNMMPDARFDGTIVGREEQLDESVSAQTTDWFAICEDQNYLTLSGGFNSSIWQFRDKAGLIIDTEAVDKQYNDLESHYTGNTIWSTVSIPKGAVEARVTYWTGEKTSVYNNPVCINYGAYPDYSVHEYKEFDIPNLTVGEKLEYRSESSTWVKVTKDGEMVEKLPVINIKGGDTVSLKGSSLGSVEIEKIAENLNEGGYGVRWSTKNTYPIGERIGNASNMNFGYEMGDQWIGTSDVNDFDRVYPWSDIRMCKIAEDGTVIYSDDVEYEQESADVMVEIPCFYVKRTIDNDYEYILISQTADEGYEIDPAFIKNGKILDKIYVGAYLSGYGENNKIGSYNDTQPIINLSLNAVKQDISEKGNNWGELDLQTLSMLQKLFLVETACKDSQALFMGVVNLSWGTCYAVKDSNNEAVNTIELEDNTSSQKINVGDSVTVFDVPQGESYYTVLTQYQNNAGWNRVITGRTRLENGNVQLEFSGEPIHISKDSTMIMNLPHRTGKTNKMEYPTGQTSGSQSGTVAFRYRYIENLWGSLCVMLDGVTVNDGVINIEEEKGLTTLGYELAEQKGTTSEGVSPAEASIHTMGFDESNPLYMLPIEVGNGASSVTGYCDALFYQKNERNLILTYGLTWDLRQYAGLFGYRANILADEAKVESGSRLVYR